jgi:hypothetical protein
MPVAWFCCEVIPPTVDTIGSTILTFAELVQKGKTEGSIEQSDMISESRRVEKLFDELKRRRRSFFPQKGRSLNAPSEHGVYIIRDGNTVLHVGRTLYGKKGLKQRLMNHLQGSSSFTNGYLRGRGARLRKGGYTYQYLEVEDRRLRALLEAYAIWRLCPEYLGVGERSANG